MDPLIRVGIALPQRLLEAFDAQIGRQGYSNRSEAIRDLLRARLVEQEWAQGGDVAGTFTLVYDHHRRDLVSRLLELQHDHEKVIVSTLHVHLDHDNCLEVLILRGPARQITALTDALRALRGVKHTTLAMTSTGAHLA
ncbi:MAG: nickel-responsive transcriptional regulator NikR [Candidatus Sumerlaeia bacterium]|nr:nickel-responsive transcriptional regulator NikR [Candidatus Sumerlaeia bacterium]